MAREAARRLGEVVGSGSMGQVVFVLHSHLPWVLGHGRWPHGEDWLYEAAAECYMPILRMLDRLASEGRNARITVGITPVLAEMLASPRFKEGFLGYLDARRSLAETDREDFHRLGAHDEERLAQSWIRFYEEAKRDFLETCDGDFVSAFRRRQEEGRLEIATSAATHGYLPLLGRDECVRAQIRAGVATHRRHFGEAPRGIWLPECAYRPRQSWSRPVGPARRWSRPGLEESLATEGLRYFFVDTHLVAGGAPLGTYDDFLEERRLDATRDATGLSPNDVHAVAAQGRKRRIAVFARDPRSSVQVWSADYGYPGEGAYLEFHRKRGRGGLRYWRITDRRLPLEGKMVYDPVASDSRVRIHAEHFVGIVRETLREHRRATGRQGVVVAPFDTELFGHWWFEGPRWLEAVLRGLEEDVEAVTASECLSSVALRPVISLPEGSWGQGGHHWVWLNDDTRWVWEIVYRAEDAFLELLDATKKRGRDDVRRLLKQIARELLLLEASDWPFLITTVAARDYAEARVRLHSEIFSRLLALAQKAPAARLSAEDEAWLAEVEARDSLFTDVNLDWWARGE